MNDYTPAKPIEAGCLAIAININPDTRPFVNNPITVLERSDTTGSVRSWFVDVQVPGFATSTAYEKDLIRIDEPPKEKSRESKR